MSAPDVLFRLRPMTPRRCRGRSAAARQLGYELDAEEMERRFVAVIATPDHSLVVAEIAGRVVACFMFRAAGDREPAGGGRAGDRRRHGAPSVRHR